MHEPPRMVFGIQAVREVLRAHGRKTQAVYFGDTDNPKVLGLRKLAEGKGVPCVPISRSELDRRTKAGMHQGILADAPPLVIHRDSDLEALVAASEARGEIPLVTIADGIMDPQNFGALVRSSVALGGGIIVFPEHGRAPLTPSTFRASAGAIEHASLVRVGSLPPVIRALQSLGFTVVLLEGTSDVALGDLDLSGPTAIVVGAEDKGAKPAVKAAVSAKAHIPMSTIDSLNASVATALALYEVRRQQR